MHRGFARGPLSLLKKMRKAKMKSSESGTVSAVKSHFRNMVVLPEMVGCIVGIHNGKTFNGIEVKHEMLSHYLGEFSVTYQPVKHGRPGLHPSYGPKFIPLG